MKKAMLSSNRSEQSVEAQNLFAVSIPLLEPRTIIQSIQTGCIIKSLPYIEDRQYVNNHSWTCRASEI